jgi:hypothetical protein
MIAFSGKTSFWQGFPGVNRLKSHKTARIRRERQRLSSNDSIETAHRQILRIATVLSSEKFR